MPTDVILQGHAKDYRSRIDEFWLIPWKLMRAVLAREIATHCKGFDIAVLNCETLPAKKCIRHTALELLCS